MSINRFDQVADKDDEETRECGERVSLNTDYKRTHLIAINSVYEGPLILGKYQFSFGGAKDNVNQRGFLIPHSG